MLAGTGESRGVLKLKGQGNMTHTASAEKTYEPMLLLTPPEGAAKKGLCLSPTSRGYACSIIWWITYCFRRQTAYARSCNHCIGLDSRTRSRRVPYCPKRSSTTGKNYYWYAYRRQGHTLWPGALLGAPARSRWLAWRLALALRPLPFLCFRGRTSRWCESGPVEQCERPKAREGNRTG